MRPPHGQTTAIFAALLLTLAAIDDPGSGGFAADLSIGEKLRIVRDKVTTLQTTPMGEVNKLAGCIAGYWRNC